MNHPSKPSTSHNRESQSLFAFGFFLLFVDFLSGFGMLAFMNNLQSEGYTLSLGVAVASSVGLIFTMIFLSALEDIEHAGGDQDTDAGD